MSITVQDMRQGPEGYAWSRFGQPEYTDWLDESLSWKQDCYIGDWSFLWQHRFTGPDALRLIADYTVNDFSTFEIGQSKHAIHTNKDGKVIHEGVLTRFGDEDFMVHGRGGYWLSFNLERGDYNAQVERDDWFMFQVSGPKAIAVLNELTNAEALLDAKYMYAVPVTIAGHDVYALRQGMAGEPGFELQGPKEFSDEVYQAVLEAGRPHGIRKMGGRIAMINHLEAAYPTIASDYIPAIFDDDMTDYMAFFLSSMPSFAQPAYIAGSFDGQQPSDYYRSPIELGWSKVVTTRRSDYLGAEALAAEKANPRRVLRTLEWNADDVADVQNSLLQEGEHYDYMEMPRDQRGYMWTDRVEIGGRLVGTATSRGYSYFFRKMLSLATIDVDHAEIGTEVDVIWGAPGHRQKTIRAVVKPAPYKTDRSRGNLHEALMASATSATAEPAATF
ncbi:glycine cleavage T C-terminal barrel domain-containing protein [Citricoccus sp. GCM10030269]|uniref:glycine cleavage T C-terminal barrel domain-containing protein n=1 Tax=Citricoccus sp. GCM10030269 TaxID=3273388 RepID=UPI00361BC204